MPLSAAEKAALLAQVTQLQSSVNALVVDTVTPPPQPPANPTITGFAANPASITAGQSSVLSATVANAVSMTLDGAPVTLPVTVTPTATKTYALVADGAPGTTSAIASVQVTVTAAQQPGAYPTSMDWLPQAPDPRGIDAGYGWLKRNPANGMLVTFGANSHDTNGNNAVPSYDPVAKAWTIRIAHTPVNLAPGANQSGKSILLNRDNSIPIIKGNFLYVIGGEKGEGAGNHSGRLDLTTWQWAQIWDTDEPFGLPMNTTAQKFDWILSASQWVPSLNKGFILAGVRNGNPNAGYIEITSAGTVAAPRRWNVDNEAPFPGAQNLKNITNQNWWRNDRAYVYGGTRSALSGQAAPPPVGNILFALDITADNAPVMTAVSTNTLPANQQVAGGGIVADYIPARDWMIATDGVRCNIYDYADGTWHFVPINNATDPDLPTPSIGPSGGANRCGCWSPEADRLVYLAGHSKLFEGRLNFQ